jgi:hypothetical protein
MARLSAWQITVMSRDGNASCLAVAALPAKPTPWDMGAETPNGVWKRIRDTSSL